VSETSFATASTRLARESVVDMTEGKDLQAEAVTGTEEGIEEDEEADEK
jgi:hypothetical protein